MPQGDALRMSRRRFFVTLAENSAGRRGARSHNRGRLCSIGGGLLWALAALFGPSPAEAGSVVAMNVPTMADLAGQVIVGTVASSQSGWADNPRRIETVVLFRDVEYLKGRHRDATGEFTLIVPGGRVASTHMRLCCAPEFRAGERWLLFLLPEYKTFPVVGLSQGAFRICADEAGVPRVYDAAGSPVAGLDAEQFVRAERRAIEGAHRRLVSAENARLKGAAVAEALAAPTAMPLGEFAGALRPILAASRDHGMTAPAGRPAAVNVRATGLIRSEAEAGRDARSRSAGVSGTLRRGLMPEEVRGPPRGAVPKKAPKDAGSDRGRRDGK